LIRLGRSAFPARLSWKDGRRKKLPVVIGGVAGDLVVVVGEAAGAEAQAGEMTGGAAVRIATATRPVKAIDN
jgi:hypothetical protein